MSHPVTVEASPVADPSTSTLEFRGVVECMDDPCTYCQRPAARYPTAKARDSYDEALASARTQAHLVYGASVHRVSVESRVVSAWTPTTPPEPTV